MKIQIKLILIFTAISLLTSTIAGTLFIIQGENSITKSMESHLESVVVLKENQLNDFINAEIVEVIEISETDLVRDYVTRLRGNPGRIDEESKREILEVLNRKLDYTELFEISIITMDGEVHTSTNPGNIGKIREKENYFIQGKKETFVQNFYYDVSLKKPAITISIPIKDKDGNVVGVIVARVRMQGIDEIMLQRSGLGETGETYLVNNFNFVVSELKKESEAALKKTIYTETIKHCLEGYMGFSYHLNYAEDEVAGFYKWIPERDACLLAEISREEALSSIIELENSLISINVILLSIFIIVGIFLSKSISKPITKLRDAAIEIGKGKLGTKIEVNSKDEIGELAYAFKEMTKNLKVSQEQIRKHAQELEQKVQKRTKELDVKVNELEGTKTAVLNMMDDTEKANIELIETQGKLKDSLIELREMDIKKDQFISIAAHELKTPLTSIHGFSQLLQNRKVANNFTKRNKYLKIMDHETKRLSKLVGDILDLSRIDLGTVKLGLDKMNVNNMMDNIRLEMDIQIKEKKLDSEYNVEKNLPSIVTDIEKLTEIIVNLINNAVKYTPRGKITIKVFKDKKDIHFMIKDTGIGISKNNHDRIFDRFYQVDSSYTREAGGTGLGLALCKEFIDILDGRIWVESEENKGSEFHFTLPIKGVSKDYKREEEIKAEETLKKSEDLRKKLKTGK